MSRRSHARLDGIRWVFGLFSPSSRTQRLAQTAMTPRVGDGTANDPRAAPGRRGAPGPCSASRGYERNRLPGTDQSAHWGRPALPSVGIVALVAGVFVPWLNISYFGVGRVSAGALDLPGGTVYAAVVAVFVMGALCGGARRRPSRVALLVMATGLAAYSAFWLLGELVLDLKSDVSLSHPSFGFGLLLSFAGSVLSVLMVRATGRRRSMAQHDDEGSDLILPQETGGRSSGLASCEELLDRLHGLSPGSGGDETVPLVFVRLDGLQEIQSRYGSPAADRISVAMAHRLRAQLRQDDTVARLAPGEVLILLSGEVSGENATVVVRRLQAILAMPVPSVKRRHAKLLRVTVQLVQAGFTNGRFQVVVDDDRLVDAPIAVLQNGRTGAGVAPTRAAGLPWRASPDDDSGRPAGLNFVRRLKAVLR